jgi:hypothetical protein
MATSSHEQRLTTRKYKGAVKSSPRNAPYSVQCIPWFPQVDYLVVVVLLLLLLQRQQQLSWLKQ